MGKCDTPIQHILSQKIVWVAVDFCVSATTIMSIYRYGIIKG